MGSPLQIDCIKIDKDAFYGDVFKAEPKSFRGCSSLFG